MSEPTWLPDCGYIGVDCATSLELQLRGSAGGGVLNAPKMSREEARAAVEAADDTIDVRNEWLAIGAPQGSQSVEMPSDMDGAGIGAYLREDPAQFQRPGGKQLELYERVARAVAKRFLTYLDEHPEHADQPVWHPAFKGMPKPLLDDLVDLSGLDPTGFQVGWAANFVKHILGAKPCPNPAVVKLHSEEALRESVAKVDAILRAARK